MTERILQEAQGLRGLEADHWLRFAAERSLSLILAYCGIEKLPEGLLRVGALLTLWIYDSGGGKDPAEGGFAKSIREGDVAITLEESPFGAALTEEKMLAYFSVELDKYRRAGW